MEKLMNVNEVAEYLGVPVQTVYRWRHQGQGPVAFKVGKHLRYRRELVDEWLAGRAAA